MKLKTRFFSWQGFALTHVLVLSFASPSIGAEILPLKAAVERARESSPDIQQAQAQYNSAVQKTWLAIAPAEPTLSIINNDMYHWTNIYTAASKVVQVTQPIGFPGRAFLTRSQLGDQAEALQYQLRALQLQVSTNVKTAYYNLQLAQKNIQLNADTRLAYERIMEVAKRRYESGATGQVDFLNANVALLSNENDLADLQTSEKQARAQLNVLLKQPVDTVVEVEPIKMIYYQDPELSLAAEKMVENRNEIRAARSSERSAQKAYKLAWMSLLPDFQVTLGTTEYRQFEASPFSSVQVPGFAPPGYPHQTFMAGIQFTIPLWFLFNERAAIAGASQDRAAAERNVDIVNNQSKVALETAVDTLHSTKAKIERFEKHILPLSDQSFKLAMTDYSSGRVDFQTLADTAAARRQARLNYANAVVTYLTTYATFGQLIGEDL